MPVERAKVGAVHDHHAAARRTGVTAVLLATLFWSFGGVFGRKAGVGGVVLTFWRMWIGTALWAGIAWALRRLPAPADFRRSAVAGVLFGLNVTAFFKSIETVSVSTALIISALAPVVALPLARWQFDERVSAATLWCGLAAIIGVIVAVLNTPSITSVRSSRIDGYLWAIVSLCLWVGYLLLAKRVRAQVETVRFMVCVSGFGSLAVSAVVVAVGADIGSVRGTGWLWVVCLAVVPGIAGHGLVAWAQPRVDASVTSVLIQAEPVFASVTAWVFLDERVSLVQAVAMAVVVLALALLALQQTAGARVELPADAPV